MFVTIQDRDEAATFLRTLLRGSSSLDLVIATEKWETAKWLATRLISELFGTVTINRDLQDMLEIRHHDNQLTFFPAGLHGSNVRYRKPKSLLLVTRDMSFETIKLIAASHAQLWA